MEINDDRAILPTSSENNLGLEMVFSLSGLATILNLADKHFLNDE